jgi:UDP-N-acetyl-D-glucosamine dehydrogenase
MRLIEAAGQINSEMPQYVVHKVREALNTREKSVNRSRVLVLGAAYKANVNDVRESPALEIMRLLEREGAVVFYHDPHVPHFTEHGITRRSVELTDAELLAADCAVIVTDHSGVDYERVVTFSALVLDTRNVTAGMKAPHLVHLSTRPALPPDLLGGVRGPTQAAAAS